MSKDYLNEFMILGVAASCVEKVPIKLRRIQIGAAKKAKKRARAANKKARRDRKKRQK